MCYKKGESRGVCGKYFFLVLGLQCLACATSRPRDRIVCYQHEMLELDCIEHIFGDTPQTLSVRQKSNFGVVVIQSEVWK